MSPFVQFSAIALIHLLAVMSPGPDVILVLRNSLRGGTRAGLRTSAGIVLANAIQIGALLLGASLLFTPGSRLLYALKLGGAAYLIYLGLSSLRSRPAPISSGSLPEIDGTPGTVSGAFVAGLLTCLTNAKAWIYWVSLGSQFLIITANNPPLRTAYVATLLLIAVLWFGAMAFLVGTPTVRTRLAAGYGLIERGMAVLLLSYGVGVLWNA